MSHPEVKLVKKTDKPFFSYNLTESSTKVNGKYYIVVDSDEFLKEIYQSLHFRITTRFKSRLQGQGVKTSSIDVKDEFDQEYAEYMGLRFAVPEDLDRYNVETTDVRDKVKTRKYTKSSDNDNEESGKDARVVFRRNAPTKSAPSERKRPAGWPRTRVVVVKEVSETETTE